LNRLNRYGGSGKRSGSFGGPKASKTPVSVGEEYDVKIEDLSRQGNAGIARIGGFVIFVNNTRPGDRVMIKITRIGNRYAVGEVLSKILKKEDTKQEMGTNEI
jgi:predicted RNA-binding protein with TRAM domain